MDGCSVWKRKSMPMPGCLGAWVPARLHACMPAAGSPLRVCPRHPHLIIEIFPSFFLHHFFGRHTSVSGIHGSQLSFQFITSGIVLHEEDYVYPSIHPSSPFPLLVRSNFRRLHRPRRRPSPCLPPPILPILTRLARRSWCRPMRRLRMPGKSRASTLNSIRVVTSPWRSWWTTWSSWGSRAVPSPRPPALSTRW
ncbi:hypothetical protein P168DRAFT_99095 [Aspergillus campestris IBT 28561]|uniref:Uncharacterized protein n=1 Tax=Aspergillus campestris (strain IBT 28561) TaxID=1392248 RepID=A0A2I1DCM4_ASPC2|nr:uncharacterized protein P168DRAFT_99095 [Aspergillus campestris IBT 28561]PKY07632.1 hypothetical protein P168DRAFT_99095 [Aspergillus campestris IBT 28561]